MLASIIAAIVSGLLKPLLDTWNLNHQINARIGEKARADTAEAVNRGEQEAENFEATVRTARVNAENSYTGLV